MLGILGLGLAIAAVVFAGFILSKKPRTDRIWSPPLAEVATFDKAADDRYTLNNVRAFEYGENGALRKEWETANVDVSDLSEVWFFIEPFSSNPLFAHSFLSFVFVGGDGARQTLSISIEARKEAGEPYSAIKGAMRAYELLYVWSTEKDVLTRIAVKLDHTLYAYKLNLDKDRGREIFNYFIKRTNDLAEHPRFYNTLHSNCTNELAKAVNDAFPGALPWHRSWVVTGRSAKWLHKLGFIDDQRTPFKAITGRADIQSLVKIYNDAPASSFADHWRNDYPDLHEKETP